MRHNAMIEQTISRYFKLDRSRRIYLLVSKDYKDQISRDNVCWNIRDFYSQIFEEFI